MDTMHRGAGTLSNNIERFRAMAEEVDLDNLDELIADSRKTHNRLRWLREKCEKLLNERVQRDETAVAFVRDDRAINTRELLRVLQILKPGLGDSDLVEQSGCFLFMDDRVATFNDEILLAANFPIGVTGAVDANNLLRTIKGIRDEYVALVEDSDTLTIKLGNDSFQLDMEELLSSELYELVRESENKAREWESLPPDLIEALATVSFSTAKTITKGVLCGVFVEADNVISCDNYRASWFKLSAKVKNPFIIPRESISILRQDEFTFGRYALDRYIIQEDSWVLFKGECILFATRTPHPSNYPELTRLLPAKTDVHTITFTKEMVKAVNDARVILEGHPKLKDSYKSDLYPLQFTFKGNKVTISAGYEVGSFTRQLDLEQAVEEEVSFKACPRLLGDALKHSREIALMKAGDNDILQFFPPTFKHIVTLS